MGRMRGVLTGLGLGVVASGLVVALAVPLVPPAVQLPPTSDPPTSIFCVVVPKVTVEEAYKRLIMFMLSTPIANAVPPDTFVPKAGFVK